MQVFTLIRNTILAGIISSGCALAPAAFAAQPRHFPAGTDDVYIASQSGVRSDVLVNIATVIKQGIASGEYPGAIVLAAHHGHLIYRGVFGNRRISPDIAPMRFNTIFDLASLTKVVATTPAIMQLVETGKLELDAPVAQYWPGFGQNGKNTITVRELLTHTSGLEPDLPDTNATIIGATATYQQIENLKPKYVAGTQFMYSDVNFIVLGLLVEKITGMPLPAYTQEHIFKLLGMKDTEFLPAAALHDRIAPTEIIKNNLRWGTVNDPTTYAMNGVSGAAGLFSSASDLGIYLQCLLDGGRVTHAATTLHGKKTTNYLLGPLTIAKMTSPQTPPTLTEVRGLGWDIDSPYANRGILFPAHSYGHTGWTGTSVWVDPATQTWLVILTSRTHPKPAGTNKLINDRRAIADILAGSLTDVTTVAMNNTGTGELSRAYKAPDNSIMGHKEMH